MAGNGGSIMAQSFPLTDAVVTSALVGVKSKNIEVKALPEPLQEAALQLQSGASDKEDALLRMAALCFSYEQSINTVAVNSFTQEEMRQYAADQKSRQAAHDAALKAAAQEQAAALTAAASAAADDGDTDAVAADPAALEARKKAAQEAAKKAAAEAVAQVAAAAGVTPEQMAEVSARMKMHQGPVPIPVFESTQDNCRYLSETVLKELRSLEKLPLLYMYFLWLLKDSGRVVPPDYLPTFLQKMRRVIDAFSTSANFSTLNRKYDFRTLPLPFIGEFGGYLLQFMSVQDYKEYQSFAHDGSAGFALQQIADAASDTETAEVDAADDSNDAEPLAGRLNLSRLLEQGQLDEAQRQYLIQNLLNIWKYVSNRKRAAVWLQLLPLAPDAALALWQQDFGKMSARDREQMLQQVADSEQWNTMIARWNKAFEEDKTRNSTAAAVGAESDAAAGAEAETEPASAEVMVIRGFDAFFQGLIQKDRAMAVKTEAFKLMSLLPGAEQISKLQQLFISHALPSYPDKKKKKQKDDAATTAASTAAGGAAAATAEGAAATEAAAAAAEADAGKGPCSNLKFAPIEQDEEALKLLKSMNIEVVSNISKLSDRDFIMLNLAKYVTLDQFFKLFRIEPGNDDKSLTQAANQLFIALRRMFDTRRSGIYSYQFDNIRRQFFDAIQRQVFAAGDKTRIYIRAQAQCYDNTNDCMRFFNICISRGGSDFIENFPLNMLTPKSAGFTDTLFSDNNLSYWLYDWKSPWSILFTDWVITVMKNSWGYVNMGRTISILALGLNPQSSMYNSIAADKKRLQNELKSLEKEIEDLGETRTHEDRAKEARLRRDMERRTNLLKVLNGIVRSGRMRERLQQLAAGELQGRFDGVTDAGNKAKGAAATQEQEEA